MILAQLAPILPRLLAVAAELAVTLPDLGAIARQQVGFSGLGQLRGRGDSNVTAVEAAERARQLGMG